MIIITLSYLLTLLCLVNVECVNFQISKKNVYIDTDSHYRFDTLIERINTQLIPTKISIETVIISTIPSYNNYFDYFYYLSGSDVSCYEQSVKNESYLFPCPFINKKNSKLRTNFSNTQKINQSIEEIKSLDFSFIIDNTLFPYPAGAYSYNPINIDFTTLINMQIDPSYQILSIRLIFINVTVFLIFIVIIIVLVVKTKKLTKMMQNSKLSSSEMKKLNSIHKRQDSDSEEEERQSTRKFMLSQNEYDFHDQQAKEREFSVQRVKQGSYMSRFQKSKSGMEEG